jgi:CheY-like chemotaxis protein
VSREDGLDELLDRVWHEHRDTNLARIEAIDRAALAVLEGTLDLSTRTAAASAAHKLTGILGTLGRPRGSVLATEAENALVGTAPIDAKRLAQLAVGLRTELDVRDAGRTAIPKRSRPVARTAVAAGVDVLLVEDDAVLADLISSALRSRGYRTEIMVDGNAALERLTYPYGRPRLVILDVDLPGLDGVSVLRGLAARRAFDQTSVIMLTVRSTEAEIISSLRLGAADHIAKPFSLGVLLEKADRLLWR